MKLIDEFKEFLKEYKVLSIAVAFILGVAVKDLVQSLVNDLIMPVINPLLGSEVWDETVINLGPIVIKFGSFLAALINFLIIALIIFLLVKILKEGKIKKK